MKLEPILLKFAGILTLATGLFCWMDPVQIANSLGLRFQSSMGQAEFMVFYGGFYSGIGVFLLVAAHRPLWHSGAFAFLTIATVFALMSRIYGLIFLSIQSSLYWQLLVGEVLYLALGAFGWWRSSAKTK